MISRASKSSILQGFAKSRSMLAGNEAFIPSNFDSIATVTVGSGGSSTITFSSIPSTYKHLQLRVMNMFVSGSGNVWDDSLLYTVNSDTTNNNYVGHLLRANGSTVSSSAYTTSGAASRRRIVNEAGGYQNGTLYPGVAVVDFLDYADTNKYKTARSLNGIDINGQGYVAMVSSLWISTNAISSLSFASESGYSFAQNTKFALYGVTA